MSATMAKAPAFQFYAADFLTDTAEMTDQEVGVYIRLLSHQWVNGSLHSDPKRLANGVAIGVLEVWQELEHKFPLCEDGRRRNERLEETRQQQQEYRDKQAEAGRAGAMKRWSNASKNNPNGDANSDPNSERIALQSSTSSSTSTKSSRDNTGDKSPKSKNKFSDEDIRLAEWMYQQLLKLNPGHKKPNLESWANDVRLINERDGKSHKEIAELFRWANNDSFWCTNILSPSKLRQKWDDLVIKSGITIETPEVEEALSCIPASNVELFRWGPANGFPEPGQRDAGQYRALVERLALERSHA